MAVSKQGLELALKMRKVIPMTKMGNDQLVSICTHLCRYSKSMKRIAERLCSEEMDDVTTRRLEDRDDELENLAKIHIEIMAQHSGIPMTPLFQGDPRGSMLKIVIPGYEHTYDCFGREGICVP
jgi:hypothetical protein